MKRDVLENMPTVDLCLVLPLLGTLRRHGFFGALHHMSSQLVSGNRGRLHWFFKKGRYRFRNCLRQKVRKATALAAKCKKKADSKPARPSGSVHGSSPITLATHVVKG